MNPSDTILERLLHLHPKKIDLSLGRVKRLAEKLNNPQNNLPPIIHVAGTNGKGSFIAFLNAILQHAGYCTGAYISPHLCDFAERITFNQQPIAEPDLARHLQTAETANANNPITFFEITTIAAFLAFAERQPDVILLEVGLGGEFDATNIITPCLSVITPISMDHLEFLGDTIEQIAAAKSGIIKRHIPVAAMPNHPTAAEVISKKAETLGSPCRIFGRDFNLAMNLPPLSLLGDHQKRNASLVIEAVAELRSQGFEIPSESIIYGLTHAKWSGRLQNLQATSLQTALPSWEIYLDGGHNISAAEALAKQAENWQAKLTLIIGMQNNKDANNFLRILKPHIEHLFAVPIATSESSFSSTELAAIAENHQIPSTACDNFSKAIEHLQNKTAGRLLICGSLYLAGEVLKACKKN